MKIIKKRFIFYFSILVSFLYIFTSLLATNNEKSGLQVAQYNTRTNRKNWGQGSVYKLISHNVECGSRRVLHGFHFIRPRDNQIAYEFTCRFHPSVKFEFYYDQTPWNETDGPYSTNFLDRHNIQCKTGYALQQFRLMRKGNKIAYEYRCAGVRNLNICSYGNTLPTFGDSVYKNIYLEKQKIFLGPKNMLTQLKLNTQYRIEKGKKTVYYYYSYGFCKTGRKMNILPKNPKHHITNNLPAHKTQNPKIIVPKFNQNKHINNNNHLNIPHKNQNKYINNKPLNNPVQARNFQIFKKIQKRKNKKMRYKQSNNFCRTFCIPNPKSKEKKCWKRGIHKCHSCEYKDQKNVLKFRDANSLCKRACNAIKNTYSCTYFPFINMKKKKIRRSVIRKYNLLLINNHQPEKQ